MGVIRRLARRLPGFGFAAIMVLTLTVAAVLASEALILRDHRDGRGMAPVDAIIVLGQGADADGRIGFAARRRVEAAVRAFRAGPARAIITTGGPDPWAPGHTGAGLQGDFAISRGVPPTAVILEERSSTTFENLRLAFEIAEARGFARLAIASDAFHLARARALAAWLGHPQVELVAAAGVRREGSLDYGWYILREALAWWFNLGKVAAWEALGLAGLDEAERGRYVR